MQLLARVPRPRPHPPLPIARPSPSPSPAMLSFRGSSRVEPRPEPEPELSFPRVYQRRDPIERMARADAREAAQHDVVLVRECVQRVECVQLGCVYG